MSTHKVVVDLIAKASGNGFKQTGAEAQALEGKVKGSQTGISGAMARIGGSGKLMGAAVAAGALAAGYGLAKFASGAVDSFISTTDAVRGFQRVAGGTAEDASRLTFALKRVGVAPEAAARGFGMLSAKIGQGKVDLAQYGVEIKKNKDGSVNMTDAVLQLSDALGSMNANARNAALKDLFGKGGQQLLPLLGKTKDELKAIFDLAGKDHQIFSQSELDKARDYKAALAEMNLAWQGMEVQVGGALVPLLTNLTEDVFTPLAQLVADNAEAFTTLAEVVGAVAVPALVALTAVKFAGFLQAGYAAIAAFGGAFLEMAGSVAVGTIAMEGFAASEEAVAVAGAEIGAGAGLGAILAIAAPVALAAGAVWGLAYAVGYFDNEQSKVSRNAPKWAENIVVQSQKATGSLDQAKNKYRDLGGQIKALEGIVGRTFSEDSRARIERGLSPQTIQQFNSEMGRTKATLNDTRARYEALGNSIQTFGGSLEKTIPATKSQKEAATVLGTAIQAAAGKADTMAAAQSNLEQALIASSQATNSDKDAKKALEDAINRVTQAQDRMNGAMYTSVDAHLATEQAERTLISAIADHADSLTIATDASAVAKARVEEYANAVLASGGAPLDAAQKTQLYIDQLRILAATSPAAAAELNPLIANLQAVIDRSKPKVEVAVNTGDAAAKLGALQMQLANLVSRSYTAVVNLFNPDGKATGGPVSSGTPYIVGEKGPEIFVPATGGNIINASDSAAKMRAVGTASSSGPSITINVATPTVTAETGRVLVEHIRAYERNSGSRWRQN